MFESVTLDSAFRETGLSQKYHIDLFIAEGSQLVKYNYMNANIISGIIPADNNDNITGIFRRCIAY